MINIQPDQVESVQQFFVDNGMSSVTLHPMVRGRLQKINDKAISGNQHSDQRAQRLAEREFNLSWASELQSDNEIIAGRWWDEKGQNTAQFSVEEGIAKTLGISLGDSMTFNIAGQIIRAEVTSLRTVQWDTFRANFFVITPPKALNQYPASYISSFYLPASKATVLDQLIDRFPNLTVIDISAIMDHVRLIIERVTLAVEYVFLFTLLAGLMVLYAAIQATQDERTRENSILRALGANKRRLLQSMVAEFSLLGALAGIMAAMVSMVMSYVLANHLLELSYTFNPWVLIVGFLGGATGVGLAGTLGTRKVLVRPPLAMLRQS